MSLSIEYIGRSKADSFWLVDALKEAGEDAKVRFQKIDFEAGDDVPDGIPGASETDPSSAPSVGPGDKPDDGPFVDVRILDDRIGNTLTDLMLDVITDADPSVPLIIAAQSKKRIKLERYVSRGAEDVLRIDDDTSGRIAWSLRFAIDRHELLRVTQSAESRIRAVVEHLREGILILDDYGRVMYANPATEDHLERPLLMLFGHELPFDIPTNDDDVVELPLQDGTMRYLSVHSGPVAWEGRDARLISLHDISTEHEARQQLHRAKREAENMASMKATFFANMSHELRLPLASIIGFAQLLEADIENEEMREFARMIREGGRGLLDTINDVLEMTRMESTGIEPTMEAVSVADLVAETVGLSSSLARARDLILDIRGDTSIVVTADSTLLKRILTNLIGNAIKFTDEGGVTATYSRESPWARIDIADTGIGMDRDFIPKMFEEFTQESSGRDRTHGGSGLGLAITRKLVDTLNGRIEVDTRKGEGTVMSVFLPLDPLDGSRRPSPDDDPS